MRSFIAIEIDRDTKEKITEIQKKLSSFPLVLPRKESLHLTLVFLGEVQEEKIKEVIEIVRSVAAKIPCFSFELSPLGAFPNLKLPKVVWIGVRGDLENLFNLEKELKKNLTQKGFLLEEEKFVPHITLGRVKSFANRKIRRRLGEEIQRFERVSDAKISCDAVSVFKSTPTPAGHVHTLLEKVPFGK